MSSRILILDYGSQFTQLITRRVREARVYSEIHPPTRTIEWIKEWNPTGIILSGGPNSVYEENVPSADPALLDIAPRFPGSDSGGIRMLVAGVLLSAAVFLFGRAAWKRRERNRRLPLVLVGRCPPRFERRSKSPLPRRRQAGGDAIGKPRNRGWNKTHD